MCPFSRLNCVEAERYLRSTLLSRSRVQLCHCDFGVVVGCKPKVDAGVADHRVWFDAVFLAEGVVQLYQVLLVRVCFFFSAC